MIGKTLSHYRILGVLGAGGMGVVYLAEDQRLGRQVALKFLPAEALENPQALDRFRLEARTASSLSHPSICAIHDIGVHEGAPFIVMELLKGETLRERVARGPLKIADVLDICIQLADALGAAHDQGVVHRDIKPANIFVGDKLRVKILDFGLAKLAREHSLLSTGAAVDVTAPADTAQRIGNPLTMPGTAIGTVSYMSPEQARGEDVDARTDIFSLGVVLYEMVTGRQAFTGSTSAVVFDAILNRAPTSPVLFNPETPARLVESINTALEKDRDLRYQHAADFEADLKRIRRDLQSGSLASAVTTTAVPAAETTRAGAPRSTMVAVPLDSAAPTVATGTTTMAPPAGSGWPWWTAAAALAAAAVVGALFLRPGPRARSTSEAQRASVSGTAILPTAPAEVPAGTPPAPAAESPLPSTPAGGLAGAPPAITANAPLAAGRQAAPESARTPPRPSAITTPAPSAPVRPAASASLASGPPIVTPSSTAAPAPGPPPVSVTPPSAPPEPPITAAPAAPAAPAPAPVSVAPAPAPAPSSVAPSTPPPAAPAPATAETDEAAIRRVIDRYQRAIETKDLAMFRSVRPGLTADEERRLRTAFEQVGRQQIEMRVEHLTVTGDTAVVRLARLDVVESGGRTQSSRTTQTLQMAKRPTGWVIVGLGR